MEENKAVEAKKVEKKKTKKKSKTDWLGSIGLTLILTAVALMIWFFLNGETTVEGGFPGSLSNSSLSCQVANKKYPVFTADNSTRKKTEVKVLFSNDGMESISLIQTMYYPNIEESHTSKIINHSDMNMSFGKAGLSADAFNATYSEQSDKMVMTLYATKSEYNEIAAKYFLVNGTNKKSTINDFTEVLNSEGFNCTIVE